MRDRAFFTLLEMLLVIAVIAILMAILLPAVSKAYSISKRANKTVCIWPLPIY